MRRVSIGEWDDVYEKVLSPIPRWLLIGASLFTDWEDWTRLIAQVGHGRRPGRLTIAGFRGPEVLTQFASVTMMSALFEHTYPYAVWSQLGVRFEKSQLVKLAEPTTPIGGRRLNIYWITDQGWSKRLRDRNGGIAAIFSLIKKAAVLDPGEAVCVQTNKDGIDSLPNRGRHLNYPALRDRCRQRIVLGVSACRRRSA
jgi:hypothetical protein